MASSPGTGALDRARAKAYVRLLPILLASYIIAYVDRVNVGFAKLTMQPDLEPLGFSESAFGFGMGVFFIGYLIAIALFGLYQALFMANAGGAWDNAKKLVEVELKQKGTPLHAATVVGDTVGDPFKDTSSVAMNPIIKFTTLFGLLAVELAVTLTADQGALLSRSLAAVFFVISVIFVWRSFYAMRIKVGAA